MQPEHIALRNEMIECAASGETERFLVLYQAAVPEVRLERPWLYVAAEYGNAELVQHLLNAGLDPNERSTRTYQWPAITAACSAGNARIVRALIEAGATIDVSNIDNSPVFAAVHGKNLECLKLLVAAGADIHMTYELPHRLKNAIVYAEEEGRADMVDYLQQLGAKGPPKKQ